MDAALHATPDRRLFQAVVRPEIIENGPKTTYFKEFLNLLKTLAGREGMRYDGAIPMKRGSAYARIEHFTKTYGTKTAVDDLSLHIALGRSSGFIGHNGAGKTTTLKACCGILQFTKERSLWPGIPSERALACKRELAYIPTIRTCTISHRPAISELRSRYLRRVPGGPHRTHPEIWGTPGHDR